MFEAVRRVLRKSTESFGYARLEKEGARVFSVYSSIFLR